MQQSAKILVVDDEAVIRDSIADILRLHGYQVLTASNGIEGLEAIRQNIPELIISDIMMPEMNGYQFYQRVRSHSEWLWIPFIFLSAKGEGEDIRFGKELGVEDQAPAIFATSTTLLKTRMMFAPQIFWISSSE